LLADVFSPYSSSSSSICMGTSWNLFLLSATVPNLCAGLLLREVNTPENIRSSSPSSQPNGKSPIMKRDQFITLVSTVALMVAYVMTSGVLTSRRSRPAHKLGTVADSRKRFHEVPIQMDDDDDE
jgi:predicted hotdog family 3-hydroxylacyl-ACP dehydratase